MKNAEQFLAYVIVKKGEELGLSEWTHYDQEGVTAHATHWED